VRNARSGTKGWVSVHIRQDATEPRGVAPGAPSFFTIQYGYDETANWTCGQKVRDLRDTLDLRIVGKSPEREERAHSTQNERSDFVPEEQLLPTRGLIT